MNKPIEPSLPLLQGMQTCFSFLASILKATPRLARCLGARVSLLAVLIASPAFAASDSKGTDFWLMFNANLGQPAMSLFITGDTATTGMVSIPGLGFSAPFTVVPGTVSTVVLPSGAQVTASDAVTNQGIHVVANAEVTVYGLNRLEQTTDAYLGLPTDILGTEHISLGYGGLGAGQIGIVGTQGGTTVTITPRVAVGSRPAGVPYSIFLNQGQTYQLSAPSSDLTGSLISATAPIAVFGGNQCANVPVGVTYCDHIVEQLPPTTTWGKAFVTMPLATRTKGDTFRIMASVNGTMVTINGANVATLNRGQFHEQIITGPARITATQPVLVAQYSNGTSFDGVTSDPFEMLIPPFEQFLAAYTVTTPASGFAINFINIVVPNAAVGSVTLDGVAVAAAKYTAIPGSAFSGAQLPVTVGAHNLAGPLPFGAFMYGYASYDSYGYPGGMSLAQVAVVTSLTLAPKAANHPVNTQQCVNATLRDKNGVAVPSVRVDFSVTGANTKTGFVNAAANGVAQFCYSGVNGGLDTIVASVGTLNDNATKTWTKTLACDVDKDGDIDIADLSLIRNAIGQVPVANDPRDANADGKITINDVRACTLRCTRTSCAAEAPPG
ncbi:hypothetical protein [Roseateles sp.]|uniref:hypothetical protein n=1 Tax=Roseateles sp. TaxID=1971397 RepID=UPI003BA627AC